MYFLKQLPSRAILERYKSHFPEMDIKKTEQALHLLRKASLLIRELEQYFATHNLSQTRFYILIILDRDSSYKNFCLMDFVKRMDVSKPVITKTLKSLQQQKLVQVVSSQTDARFKTVTITTTGRDALYSVLPGYYTIINKHISKDGWDAFTNK
jgi:DNA-binding MarR family transcriptional regulator